MAAKYKYKGSTFVLEAFTGKFKTVPWLKDSQFEASGQSEHFGFFGVQTVAPNSIMA